MSNQMTLFAEDPADYSDGESLFLDCIKPYLVKTIDELWADPALLVFRANQAKDNGSPDSVWYGSSLLLKIALKAKRKYIAVPSSCVNALSPLLETKSLKSEEGYVRVFLDNLSEISNILDAVSIALKTIVSSYPFDFDCCSRYRECSNAKKCTQPNKGLSMGCSYKQKLYNGIVFFGQNQTML